MTVNTGSMYAVAGGDYGGTYFVVCKQTAAYIDCVQLPEKTVVSVPNSSFTTGLTGKLLQHVADLPEGVYAYCKEIYENNNI